MSARSDLPAPFYVVHGPERRRVAARRDRYKSPGGRWVYRIILELDDGTRLTRRTDGWYVDATGKRWIRGR